MVKKKIDLAALRKQRADSLLVSEFLATVQPEAHFQLGGTMEQEHIPFIPTGVFPLDYALCGGLPVGRISVLFGMENSSKTTTFLKAMAQAQRMCATCYRDVEFDGCLCDEVKPFTCAFIDVEGSLDIAWAKHLGVDTDNTLISKPETAEAALDLMNKLLESGECDLIVLDSMAALEPQAELELAADKSLQPGSQARLLGQSARKVMSRLNAMERETGHRPTIWMTNQIRYKIGVAYGDPEVRPGGKAFDFATAVIVRLRGSLKFSEKTKEITHNEVHFRVDKVKRNMLKEGEFRLVLAKGVRKVMGDIYDEGFIMEKAEYLQLLLPGTKGSGGKWVLTLPGEEPRPFPKREAIEEALFAEPEWKRRVMKVLVEIALAKKEGE